MRMCELCNLEKARLKLDKKPVCGFCYKDIKFERTALASRKIRHKMEKYFNVG